MSFSKTLQESKLRLGKDAAAAIEGGWIVTPFAQIVSCLELERTYRVRYQHLLILPGSHAAQLAACIGELTSQLLLHHSSSIRILTIRGSAEHHFLVFVLAESNEVIGCLRTISKLEVPGERWQELWSGAV